MKDVRSPQAKEKAARRLAEMQENRKTYETIRGGFRRLCWSSGAPWQPIETCPFEAFDAAYEFEGAILVTNGKADALATVKKRFGRPVRCVEPPEMVMTDHGFSYTGGKYEEIEAPAWWVEWELTDAFGSENYAGGEPIGKDEVDFIPTHWMPLPRGLG